MRINTAHRNKIWKALVEWRESINNTVDLSQLQPSLGSTSDPSDPSADPTLGLTSQSSLSQQSTYCPGYYEITRYTFKQVFSFVHSAESDEEGEREGAGVGRKRKADVLDD